MLDRLFLPDYMMNGFADLSPELLECIGARVVLTDIDNTLALYGERVPSPAVVGWVCALRACGIRVALVSNAAPARVRRFGEALGLPAYADARKPRTRALLRAMRKLGGDPGNTVLLANRLLTDVLAGNRLGLTTVAVPPLRARNTRGERLARLLEQPYVRRYNERKNRGLADL